MSITSTRVIAITFAGDQAFSLNFSAASNTQTPCVEELIALTTGTNTITVPTGGSTPTGVTIVPPVGNTNSMTLKGVSGDTGIVMALTSPTSLALGTTVTTFAITCAGPVNTRFIWT